MFSVESSGNMEMAEELSSLYIAVRSKTLEVCDPLENEDLVVQPIPDVSPPKWHLGHTTWFFEELILVPFLPGFKRFNEKYRQLFNSYYKSAGKHWLQKNRGDLSRPTLFEILAYRTYIDEAITQLLKTHAEESGSNVESNDCRVEIKKLLEVGLHHEQQHQELLYMDIKYILGANPLSPTYCESSFPLLKEQSDSPLNEKWKAFDEGVYEIGHEGKGFSYDNETPRHKNYVYPFSISESLVTNGEFLQFILDEAYSTPKYWLSKGWDWLSDNGIEHPLYWQQQVDHQKENNIWYEFTLYGMQSLDLNAPVSHISYFEADAYANWKSCRLPTEHELEIYLESDVSSAKNKEDRLHPAANDGDIEQLWCWTKSHYSPYPNYQPFDGMLEEYNGKFMCNQFVLKGGCVVTPQGNYRHSYRNFYEPHQRWMFSGIRLAKDE